MQGCLQSHDKQVPGLMIDPASSQVVPGSAIAWSAFLAGLQLSGAATRGVLSSQPSGTPLSAADRLRWDARLVSTAHSLVLVVGVPVWECVKQLHAFVHRQSAELLADICRVTQSQQSHLQSRCHECMHLQQSQY